MSDYEETHNVRFQITDTGLEEARRLKTRVLSKVPIVPGAEFSTRFRLLAALAQDPEGSLTVSDLDREIVSPLEAPWDLLDKLRKLEDSGFVKRLN